jgi:hypothetical protein
MMHWTEKLYFWLYPVGFIGFWVGAILESPTTMWITGTILAIAILPMSVHYANQGKVPENGYPKPW